MTTKHLLEQEIAAMRVELLERASDIGKLNVQVRELKAECDKWSEAAETNRERVVYLETQLGYRNEDLARTKALVVKLEGELGLGTRHPMCQTPSQCIGHMQAAEKWLRENPPQQADGVTFDQCSTGNNEAA